MNEKELRLVLRMRDDATKALQGFAAKGAAAMRSLARRSRQAFADFSRSVAGAIKNLFSLRTLLVTGIAAIAMRKVIRAFENFQKSMNRVGALTGETGASFQRLNEFAQELGRTTEFSAAQAADGMALLAQAGLQSEAIMGALPNVLRLASAAQIDMAQAAEISTNILFQLGLEVSDLADANDVLVKAFTSSKTNLQSLGEAFKFAGPLATSAGQDFKEITAVLGQLGQAGFEGSIGGTVLRNAIIRLLNPSREAASTLERLGIEVYDSEGNMRSLTDVIGQFESKAVKAEDVIKIFSARAGPGMAALISRGTDKLKEFRDLLEDSGGIAEEIQKRQLEGFRGAVVRMRSAVEGAAISIGEELEPVLIKAADFVKAFANEVVGALKELNKTTGGVEEAADGFESFSNRLHSVVKALVVVFFGFKRVLIGAKLGLLGVGFAASLVLSGLAHVGAGIGLIAGGIISLLEGPLRHLIFTAEKAAWVLGQSGLALSLGEVRREIDGAGLAVAEAGFDVLGTAVDNTDRLSKELSATWDDMGATVTEETILLGKLDAAQKGYNKTVMDAQQPITELTQVLSRFGAATAAAELAAGRVQEITIDPKTAAEAITLIKALEQAWFKAFADTSEEGQARAAVISFALDTARVALSRLSADEAAAAARRVSLGDVKAAGLVEIEQKLAEELRLLHMTEDEKELLQINQKHAAILDSVAEFKNKEAALFAAGEIRKAQIANLEEKKRQKRQKESTQATMAALQFITSSALRENKKFFEIIKVADIAQAIADTYTAATAALKAGPVAGPILAGIITAAGLANVAKIRATQFGGGSSGGGGSLPAGGATIGGGPAAGALPAESLAAPTPVSVAQSTVSPTAPPAVSITVNGAVGNEEEVARRLAELVDQAIKGGAQVGIA